jgi:hypothetical protein
MHDEISMTMNEIFQRYSVVISCNLEVNVLNNSSFHDKKRIKEHLINSLDRNQLLIMKKTIQGEFVIYSTFFGRLDATIYAHGLLK